MRKVDSIRTKLNAKGKEQGFDTITQQATMVSANGTINPLQGQYALTARDQIKKQLKTLGN